MLQGFAQAQNIFQMSKMLKVDKSCTTFTACVFSSKLAQGTARGLRSRNSKPDPLNQSVQSAWLSWAEWQFHVT